MSLERVGGKSFPRDLNPSPISIVSFIQTSSAMWLDDSDTGYPDATVDAIACPTLIARGDLDHLVPGEPLPELSGRLKDTAFANLSFAGHLGVLGSA